MILAPRHLILHLTCGKVDSAKLWVLQMKTHKFFVVVDFREKGYFGMFGQVSPRFLTAIMDLMSSSFCFVKSCITGHSADSHKLWASLLLGIYLTICKTIYKFYLFFFIQCQNKKY